MADFDFDAVVVGAGCVGLATAYALGRRGLSVAVLEKEAAIGQGVSSRNSEVIHGGLYYPTGSLKAELCVAASPYKDATIRYTGGDRGWPGDVPRSYMNPEKLAKLGFRVRNTSDEAVRMAVEALAKEVFPEG